jgi:transposase-like protein
MSVTAVRFLFGVEGEGAIEHDQVSEARTQGTPDSGRRETPGAGANETLERPRRRVFSQEFKERILAEADALADVPGGIGKLLRREGIYSSNLTAWRQARARGDLAAKRRGPKPQGNRQERRRLEQLERENERLRHRLKQAETIIEFQKSCRLCWRAQRRRPSTTGRQDSG